MEVFSIVGTVCGVAFGAIGTYIGVSRYNHTKLKQLIDTEINLHLGSIDVKLNTLDLRLDYVEQSAVKKEDMAEVKSDLKAVMQRLDDLKDLIISVR